MIVTRRVILVALVCATVSWWSPPAVAKGPDASNPPRVSGPLVGSPFGCEDNGPAGPREAKAQSCAWLYDLLPAETNLGEDFSAYWIQLEIDPGKRFCAKEIGFKLSEPAGVRLVSAVPDAGHRITASRLSTTELIVDAEGTAPVPGTVAQDVKLGTGRITASLDEQTYAFRWKGNSRDKVVVAVGIQLAHAGLPPDFFYGWSESVSFAIGSCRAPTVRAQ